MACDVSFFNIVLLYNTVAFNRSNSVFYDMLLLIMTHHQTQVTDLRISQIGHGLGPRAFGGPAQLLPMTTQH